MYPSLVHNVISGSGFDTKYNARAQRVPDTRPLHDIFSDTRPDPIQF